MKTSPWRLRVNTNAGRFLYRLQTKHLRVTEVLGNLQSNDLSQSVILHFEIECAKICKAFARV